MTQRKVQRLQWNPLVTSNRFDHRLSQIVCFGGAPLVFACGILTIERLGATPAELMTGMLAASAVSIGLVILGFVAVPRGLESNGRTVEPGERSGGPLDEAPGKQVARLS